MAKGFFIGVDGVAKKVKQGFIGVGLPSGYTQVEYIESSGTQYIDTGFYPKYNSRVELDVSDFTNTTAILFGSKDADSATATNQFSVYRNSSSAIRCDYFGTNVSMSISDTTSKTTVIRDANVVTAWGVTATNTAVTSGSVSYPMMLLTLNTAGTYPMGNPAICKVYGCRIYDGGLTGSLVRNYVPVVNSSGEAGLYDLVTMTFYGNAGTGAFTAGNSVSSSAVARRIKEAFIGIGGVARPCWSGGELAYYGTITGLSVGRSQLAATNIGNYVLFGGGYDESGRYSAVVDAYSQSLTRTEPEVLSVQRYGLSATTVGNYAMFGGGMYSSKAGSNVVDAYDGSFTHTQPTALNFNYYYLAATSVGSYALFGGGFNGSSDSCNSTVNAYDESLTRTIPTALSVARQLLSATTIGDYALFGGGGLKGSYGTYNTVDAYDKSLTRTTPTGLSVARYTLASTTVGDYALFCGGYEATNNTHLNTVDAYDKSLTRTVPTALSVARSYLAATTIGDYALFGGGSYGTTHYSTVDAYDSSLVHTNPAELSAVRDDLAAATVGNYALFGGGAYYTNTNYRCSTVDAFTLQ